MAYYNSYKPAYQNTTYKKQPSASEKYKNNKYSQIVVTVQPGKGADLKTKQTYKVINLYNVDEQSAQEIVNRLTDTSKNRVTRNAWVAKDDPTHLQIKVFDNEIDNWLDGGDLNALQAVLIHSGKYNNDEVLHIEDEIASGFQSMNKELASDVYNTAFDNSMTMWQDYLSKINDPVTRAQIELYSRVYGNVSYGHILSVKNAQLIRSVAPDATFVLPKGQWAMFGRGVKRGAKPLPYYVWVPNNDTSKSEFQNAKAANGWENTDDSELSLQVKKDINIKGNQSAGFTLKKIAYDVKDTYLYSGAKEDPWTSQIGLLNNLTGELNAAAQQDQVNRNGEKPSIDGNDEMMKRTEKACIWMETFCKESGYNATSAYQDASNKLADYLVEYCTVNATKKSNILNSGNARIYGENATQVTLIITRLGWDALKRFNRTYTYDKKEATALMNVVFGIAKKLEENAVLDEGIGSWLLNKAEFIKRFIQALKQIGCSIVNNKTNNQPPQQQPVQEPVNNGVENAGAGETLEEIKNKFYDIYNRISSNLFYD